MQLCGKVFLLSFRRYGRVFVSKNAILLVLFNPEYGSKIRSVIPFARLDHHESGAIAGTR